MLLKSSLLRLAINSGACVACAALLATSAWGQQVAGGRGLTLKPTFEAALSFSDIRSDVVDRSGRDLITRLSPGFRLRGGYGKSRFSATYTLNAVQHTRDGVGSEVLNSLNSSLSSELVDGRVFVDALATVSSSSLDAFGRQSVPGSFGSNGNRAEVATVTVSPSLRGQLGREAGYELKLNAGANNTRRSKEGDSTNFAASFALNSSNSLAILGWGLQASRQRTEFRTTGASTADRAVASISIRPDAGLVFTLRGGREANDLAEGGERRSYDTAGGSVTWKPSTRTTAMFESEHRYFGQSRRVLFQHRMPRTAVNLTLTRDVSGSSNPNGVGAPLTLYQMLDALLVSRFPDPTERDAAVLVALEGRDPNTIVSGGFVSSTQQLQDRADLAWSYSGLRMTLGLQAFASSSKALNNGSFDGEAVRQRSYTTTVGYRLTPTASVNLTGSRLMTLGTESRQGTDLKSLSMGYADQLSRLVSMTMNLRYSVFNSPTDPYREISATAAVSLRF